MNIKQAKEYIVNTVKLYLKKDEFGEYRLPLVRQRPIFLLGAPGIGKTAVMEQIAQEMGVALVSYSMTHHTRQSALGLPYITQKEYDGQSFSVTEYTMSEIIASLYDVMENSGIREGILFLDEINCVSETLSPAMLQFLQYKTFGRHRVPQGWVIVTAGNPPEYNRSVREFDIVTMDRLKVLEVEADYPVWKEYAACRGIHSAVTTYLDQKKEHFYRMETTARGRSYVTARGWEDLSQILFLHEEEGLAVDEALVGQYLRNEKVVREFTAYYDLFQRYKKEYAIADILKGTPSEETVARAKEAAFDERLSLLGMLLDRVQAHMKEDMEDVSFLTDLRNVLKGAERLSESGSAGNSVGRDSVGANSTGRNSAGGDSVRQDTAGRDSVGQDSAPQVREFLEKQREARRKLLERLREANALSDEEKRKHNAVLRFLEEAGRELCAGKTGTGDARTENAARGGVKTEDAESADIRTKDVGDGKSGTGDSAYALLKNKYQEKMAEVKAETRRTGEELHALFSFAEAAFGEGNEMLVLVTELTAGDVSSRFIAAFGSPDYARHSRELMLSERRDSIREEIEGLEIFAGSTFS